MFNQPKIRPDKRVDVLACDQCKNTWLAKMKVNRYSPMPKALTVTPDRVYVDDDFIILQCIACGNFIIPPVEGYLTGTITFRNYEEMLDEITDSKEELEKKQT